VPIDRLVPHDRKHADSITTTIAAAAETPPPPPSDDFAWIVPTIRARLLKVSANGHERRVPVEIVSVAQKPSMKELLAAIGSMMLQDPLLLASVGEGERAEKLPVVEEEGLRCYYCYDEVYADATYQDHIAVCAARYQDEKKLENFIITLSCPCTSLLCSPSHSFCFHAIISSCM
jgi:hypothetical protein